MVAQVKWRPADVHEPRAFTNRLARRYLRPSGFVEKTADSFAHGPTNWEIASSREWVGSGRVQKALYNDGRALIDTALVIVRTDDMHTRSARIGRKLLLWAYLGITTTYGAFKEWIRYGDIVVSGQWWGWLLCQVGISIGARIDE